MQERDEMKYAELFSKWYSWGSPVGLSIFFISMACTVLLIISALNKVRYGQYELPTDRQTRHEQIQ